MRENIDRKGGGKSDPRSAVCLDEEEDGLPCLGRLLQSQRHHDAVIDCVVEEEHLCGLDE